MTVPIKKRNLFKRKRFWAGILLAQFILFYIFSKIDGMIILFQKFFEIQKGIHQKTGALFPFSAGDIIYISAGLLIVFCFFKILRKRTRPFVLLKLLISLNAFYFVYQIFWGMLYFQKPLIESLPKENITLEETKRLSLKYLNLCRSTRLLVEEDQNGVFKIDDLQNIESEILGKQNILPGFTGSKKAENISAFKPSIFSDVMSYTGILGYYNPFTAEAQYNAKMPAIYLPFTLAHESMHQLGFAREQEANFTAYLIGKNAVNIHLKYSTEYYVLRSLLNSLAEKNPEFVKMVLQNYSPGMKRDRREEKNFYEKHTGVLEQFFSFTNDLFLKSNQQEGKITYSYFVELLLRYERL